MKTIHSIFASMKEHESLSIAEMVCIKGGGEEDKRRGLSRVGSTGSTGNVGTTGSTTVLSTTSDTSSVTATNRKRP